MAEPALREDLEATSGSATALLRTLVGSMLRPLGGWMSAAGTVHLLGSLGIPPATARSSIARLVARGVLRRAPGDGGVPGYSLDPAAVPMLERGDARIFGERRPATAWCLVSYSFPERQRSLRHQLRRRLAAIGCGTVADGLWIGPAALERELAEVVAEFDAVLFVDAAARSDLSAGLASWYDLPAIRRVHETFIDRFGAVDVSPTIGDEEAFALWVRALDEWRVVPYRDPGLPPAALPDDWPGDASAALFGRLRDALEQRAVGYASRIAGPDRVPAVAR
ncbi:PaaX family transcriptional regulator [Leifsonia naganoensis]|uniref:Phenylacetic acid degradation operon negative regulatory protein n=1 Tax=Leifsonia naganoensis TaxID=150025 RepID=A0A853DM85_9MICO|nr:PaaX family transcriptional regulator C-terminal domain-containing protein [Leifsonia naganoensis]NYK10312.1 phenylacetic acid degradation operon negative regulatory protein [Leifsonia naganoensis]